MNQTILVAEDCDDDAFLFRQAAARARQPHNLQFVHDGQEAVEYLRGQGQFADRQRFPVPDLVVLDLKMPRMDGFECLEWIRSRPEFKGLKVVVLTGSIFPTDKPRAIGLGAKGVFVKPVWISELVDTVREIFHNFLRPNDNPQPS